MEEEGEEDKTEDGGEREEAVEEEGEATTEGFLLPLEPPSPFYASVF